MAYRTLAWVMALICGLAIPAGAATLADAFFDEPIFQPHAYEKFVNIQAKTRVVVTRNVAANSGVQDSAMLAATTAHGKAGSIIAVVDNALLVSVNGHALVDNGMGNGMTYDKTTVASLNNCFNNSTGVANVNLASGNLNIQRTYYSGPDLTSSGLLANGGSANLPAIRK